MKINISHVIGALCVVSVLFLEARYIRQRLKQPVVPEQLDNSEVYVTDDEQYAVNLSFENIRTIERIMRSRIMWDKDYNQKIDKGFIRRTIGTCNCGADAAMLEKVLNDFEGKTVEQLYTELGLSRRI